MIVYKEGYIKLQIANMKKFEHSKTHKLEVDVTDLKSGTLSIQKNRHFLSSRTTARRCFAN